MMGANALTVIPAIIGTAVAIVFGLPVLIGLLFSAGRAAREEEQTLAAELRRKAPEIKLTPRPRPYIRETHVLDYSTMTSAQIASALNPEAEVRPSTR